MLLPSSLLYMLQKCSMQTFQVSCSSLDCEGFVVAENLRVRNLNLPVAQQSDHLSARGDRGMLLENLAQRSSAFHLTRLLGRRILLPPESRRGRQFLKVRTFRQRDSEPVADRLIAQPDKPPVSRCFDCLAGLDCRQRGLTLCGQGLGLTENRIGCHAAASQQPGINKERMVAATLGEIGR